MQATEWDPATFAETFQHIQRHTRLTLNEIAANPDLKITYSQVSRWARGMNRPSHDSISAFAEWISKDWPDLADLADALMTATGYRTGQIHNLSETSPGFTARTMEAWRRQRPAIPYPPDEEFPLTTPWEMAAWNVLADYGHSDEAIKAAIELLRRTRKIEAQLSEVSTTTSQPQSGDTADRRQSGTA